MRQERIHKVYNLVREVLQDALDVSSKYRMQCSGSSLSIKNLQNLSVLDIHFEESFYEYYINNELFVTDTYFLKHGFINHDEVQELWTLIEQCCLEYKENSMINGCLEFLRYFG